MTPEQEEEYQRLLKQKADVRRQIEKGELTGTEAEEASKKAFEELDTFKENIRGRNRDYTGHA